MQPKQDKKALYSKLIQGCLQKQRSAQKELYDLMSPRMFAICRRYADSYQTAEDLLQEGFIKVYKHIGNYRGDGSFEGWVKRIFINTAIEHFRKQARMYPITNLESVDYYISVTNMADRLELEDLQNMIKKLSPGYRTVFNLYIVEGYSHREIGEMLNISEGTSKSQLSRARYLLQKMIVKADMVEEHEALAK
ncbi:MAG: RNA polymerase sigma factor [Bacteroidetes bacterium]|nr:RNA polymerase sigma factor [Bacteroidota bacterium]